MAKVRIFVLSAVAALLAGCPLPPKPPLDSWSDFETSISGWFNQHYGDGSNMRFAPVGIAYPIGTVLRKGTFSAVSSKCEFHDVLPSKVQGPNMPSITSSRTISASLDPSSYAAKLLGEGSKIHAGLNYGPTLSVKIIDPLVIVIAEDQTAGVLRTPECLSAVVGQEVSVVRGYVEARYSVSSKSGGTVDGEVTIGSDNLAKLTVDGSNAFTVEDARPTDKLVILSDANVVKAINVFFPPSAPSDGSYSGPIRPMHGECFEVPRLVLKGADTSSAGGEGTAVKFLGRTYSSCAELKNVGEKCSAEHPDADATQCPPVVSVDHSRDED